MHIHVAFSRAVSTVVALAMACTLVAAPLGAEVRPEGPELAGTTVLTFDGPSAIQVRLPRPVTLTRDSFDTHLEGDTGAFVLLSPRNLPPAAPYECRSAFVEQNDGDGPGEEWCQDYSITVADGWLMSPDVFADHRFPVVSSQVLNIAAVTNGVLELTIHAPELDGEVRHLTTGSVEGQFLELPRSCPMAATPVGCEGTGFGGHAFNIPVESRVGSIAIAERPNRIEGTPGDPITPGFHNAGACVYPSFGLPDASSDPEDYPLGCDPAEDGAFTSIYGVLAATQVGLGLTYGHLRAEYVPEGDRRYVGYAANAYDAAALAGSPARYWAYGYWMAREITCPSGDWTAC